MIMLKKRASIKKPWGAQSNKEKWEGTWKGVVERRTRESIKKAAEAYNLTENQIKKKVFEDFIKALVTVATTLPEDNEDEVNKCRAAAKALTAAVESLGEAFLGKVATLVGFKEYELFPET